MNQFGTREHYEEYVRNCRNAGIVPETWEEFQIQCSNAGSVTPDYPSDYKPATDIDDVSKPGEIIARLQAENAALKARVARLEAAYKELDIAVEGFIDEHGDWSPKQREMLVSSDAIHELMDSFDKAQRIINPVVLGKEEEE